MEIDIRKIKKLVRFMKKEGVLSMKVGGIEMSISPSTIQRMKSHSSESDSIETLDAYTEDQVLLWSAPGGNEASL